MFIFGDKIEVHCEKDFNGRYHGNAYALGDRYVFICKYVNGKINGNLRMFDNDSGEEILKANIINNEAHGRYEFYSGGALIERGIYKHGAKYFHMRFKDGKVYEYGFSKDDKLNGFGSTTDQYGFIYTSPHWVMGEIHGLGCIEDPNGEVTFYGMFRNNMPEYECRHKHPMMLKKWHKSHRERYSEVPLKCAEYVLT